MFTQTFLNSFSVSNVTGKKSLNTRSDMHMCFLGYKVILLGYNITSQEFQIAFLQVPTSNLV